MRAKFRRFDDMNRRSHRGHQHFGLERRVVAVNGDDLADQFHPDRADIVESTDERRDEAGARLGGEKRLRRRKA